MSSAATQRAGTSTISQTSQSFGSLKNIRNLSLDATGKAVIEQPAPHWVNQACSRVFSCCNRDSSTKSKCDQKTFDVLFQVLSNLQEQNLETFRTDIQTKRIFCNLNKDQRSHLVAIITQKISSNIRIEEAEKKSDSKKDQPLLPPKPETLIPATLERTPPDVPSKKEEAKLSPPPPAQPAPAASTRSIVSVAQLYAFTPQRKKDDSDSSGEEHARRPTQESSISWQQDYERAIERLSEKHRPLQEKQMAAPTPPLLQAHLPQANQDALRRRPLQSTETCATETGTVIPNFGIKVLPDDKDK